MADRQNPYFRAAMRNEGLEAACRASAAWIERFLSEGAAREAFSSDSPDSGLSDEDWSLLREMLLEQAQILDGELPEDPAAFAARLNRLVLQGVGSG